MANTQAIEAGELAKALLEAVRKAKSEANKSIKYPASLLSVRSKEAANASLLEDVKAAGNVESVRWDVDATADTPLTEVTLAEEADAA